MPMHDPLQEVLEELWTMREREEEELAVLEAGVGGRLGSTSLESLLEEGERQQLLERAEGKVRLLEEGDRRARKVIRRHRLAEMLFHQVLALPEGEAERTACELEHQLSTATVEAVCAFLGHPPHCPHGKPIPRGECCRRFSGTMRPLIVPLSDVQPGREVRITFISPGDPHLLERLGSLGIVPGALCHIRTRRPAVVLDVGETSVALDRTLVERVFVREEDVRDPD
jgi:DtxR family Mn-dependent transcriptional regulator